MLMLLKRIGNMNRTKMSGFTIVELLIVIVVIGILAAITIVAYNGISGRAKEATLTSDLNSATKKIETERVLTGSYPSSAASADGGQGLKSSPGNTFAYYNSYKGQTDSYCLAGTLTGSIKKYYITNTTGFVQEGVCDRAFVTKGSAGPSCGANCFYLILNTADFTAGSYSIQCVLNGTPGSTTVVSLSGNGSYQTNCYQSSLGQVVYININGWGRTPSFTW